MPIHEPSIASKAFGKQADPALIVAYQSHQDAMRFLASALAQPSGIAMLQGPSGSGKTTFLKKLTQNHIKYAKTVFSVTGWAKVAANRWVRCCGIEATHPNLSIGTLESCVQRHEYI